MGLVDCDDSPDLCQRMNIQFWPQLRVFKKGPKHSGSQGELIEIQRGLPAINAMLLSATVIRAALEWQPHLVGLEQRVRSFYEVHASDKIAAIPEMLEKWAGMEDDLISSLEKKYDSKLPAPTTVLDDDKDEL